MTLGLSPHLRLIVLIGLLGIVGLSGGVLVLAKVRKPAAEQAAATTPAARAEVATTPAVPSAPAATAPVSASGPAPVAASAPTEPAEPVRPATVTRAMRSHAVVVVALYAPNVPLDAEALAEAREGAAAAGAGFAAVNVADEDSARWVAQNLTGATDPTVVVLREGKPAAQLFGFADHGLVARAAARQ